MHVKPGPLVRVGVSGVRCRRALRSLAVDINSWRSMPILSNFQLLVSGHFCVALSRVWNSPPDVWRCLSIVTECRLLKTLSVYQSFPLFRIGSSKIHFRNRLAFCSIGLLHLFTKRVSCIQWSNQKSNQIESLRNLVASSSQISKSTLTSSTNCFTIRT